MVPVHAELQSLVGLDDTDHSFDHDLRHGLIGILQLGQDLLGGIVRSLDHDQIAFLDIPDERRVPTGKQGDQFLRGQMIRSELDRFGDHRKQIRCRVVRADQIAVVLVAVDESQREKQLLQSLLEWLIGDGAGDFATHRVIQHDGGLHLIGDHLDRFADIGLFEGLRDAHRA